MNAGKIPGKPLDPNNIGPIRMDMAEIDSRGRIIIPRHIGENIEWFVSGDSQVEALIVLNEPGMLTFYNWDAEGQKILDKRLDLIKEVDADPNALEALRLLEDRYKRISIPKDLRPTLGLMIIQHLGLSRGTGNVVYVTSIHQGRLIVMSPEFRNKKLLRSSDLLYDLP